MKMFMMCLLALAFFSSCNSMKGSLSVKKAMVLNTDSRRQIKIKPGRYKAVLSPSSKTKLRLTVTIDNKKMGFPFAVASGTQLPTTQGSITIRSTESKQPVDLRAVVSTKTSSNIYNTTEKCVSHYEYDRVCTVDHSRLSAHCQRAENRNTHECRSERQNSRVCRHEQTPVYGLRDARYNAITTTKTVNVSLITRGSSHANFVHNNSSTDHQLISAGSCF